jgi:hypothetical protein
MDPTAECGLQRGLRTLDDGNTLILENLGNGDGSGDSCRANKFFRTLWRGRRGIWQNTAEKNSEKIRTISEAAQLDLRAILEELGGQVNIEEDRSAAADLDGGDAIGVLGSLNIGSLVSHSVVCE